MKSIFFFFFKCNGCHSCQAACCDINYDSNDPSAVFIINMLKYVNPKNGFVKLVANGCRHCDPAPCIQYCPNKAIKRNQQNRVVIDKKICTNCQVCLKHCPYQAIIYHNQQVYKCHGCCSDLISNQVPACIRNCPLGAIIIQNYD